MFNEYDISQTAEIVLDEQEDDVYLEKHEDLRERVRPHHFTSRIS